MTSHDLPEPVFLSAPKAATLCGVSRNTICCWIRDGKLPSYRTAGGKNLIRPGDLVGFMKANSMFVPQSLAEMAEQDSQTMKGAAEEKTTSTEPSILVVEDDPNARALAVRCLQELKLPILEAETGYEALHMLTQHPEVAIIMLDLIMPGQQGSDTFVEIRNQNKSLPVIVVTGMPAEEVEQSFTDVQPDLVITKPYEPQHLLDAAKVYLSDLGL